MSWDPSYVAPKKPSAAAMRRIRSLTPEEVSALIDPVETLYLPLAAGKQARVMIEIIEDGLPTPGERPIRRQPTVRELHAAAEALLKRLYQFHPVD